MPSAKNFLGLLEKLQSADITVHQNRCAVVRNRNATCMKCAEVCTSGCISYNDNELIISPEKCIGCGTCATVCPTCALEAHRPNDAELLHRCIQAMRAADGEVVIAYEQIVNAAEGLLDLEKSSYLPSIVPFGARGGKLAGHPGRCRRQTCQPGRGQVRLLRACHRVPHG